MFQTTNQIYIYIYTYIYIIYIYIHTYIYNIYIYIYRGGHTYPDDSWCTKDISQVSLDDFCPDSIDEQLRRVGARSIRSNLSKRKRHSMYLHVICGIRKGPFFTASHKQQHVADRTAVIHSSCSYGCPPSTSWSWSGIPKAANDPHHMKTL